MAKSSKSSAPGAEKSGGKKIVRAAGALVWREAGKNLEVLLVHRPKYDDWSFPKGKVEKGESLRTCAVREVGEETGAQIRLEQPLTPVRYKLNDGARKEVHYWAARVLPDGDPSLAARAAVDPAPATEIDGVEWVATKVARKRLTHGVDRDLLGELVDLWEDGKLDTWTFVLVRHARAVKRSVWNRPKERTPEEDEATRPLTQDQGEVRATAIVPVLAAYGVGRVVTSPWKRCVDTVAPYAAAAGLEVEPVPALTEHAHAAKPKGVRKAVSSVIRDRERPVALCTHRPVLPSVFAALGLEPVKLERSGEGAVVMSAV